MQIDAFFLCQGFARSLCVSAVLFDIIERLRKLRAALLHHLLQERLRITSAFYHPDHLPELAELRCL